MYVLPGIFPERNQLVKQLLRLLRLFLNLNAYSSFERHTETTIKAIHSELRTWANEVEVRCSDTRPGNPRTCAHHFAKLETRKAR